jgi:hypothetical protein
LQKDLLSVKVNQLSSIKTQLPYSYYSLPFCRPEIIVDSAENLGEVLRGDRIENSLYVVSAVRACHRHYRSTVHIPCMCSTSNLLQNPRKGSFGYVCCNQESTQCCRDDSNVITMQFEMMEPRLCQIVCKVVLSQDDAKDLKEKIDDEYRVNM